MAVCSDRCHSSYVMSLWYVCIRRGVSQRLMHFFIHTWRTDDSAITRACVTAVIVSLAVARCSRTTLSHAICSRLNHILSRNCLRSHASEVHVACVWPCDVRPRFFCRPLMSQRWQLMKIWELCSWMRKIQRVRWVKKVSEWVSEWVSSSSTSQQQIKRPFHWWC